jgi:hypothetical protein
MTGMNQVREMLMPVGGVPNPAKALKKTNQEKGDQASSIEELRVSVGQILQLVQYHASSDGKLFVNNFIRSLESLLVIRNLTGYGNV